MTPTQAQAESAPRQGSWMEQLTRDPRLDEAIANFMGSIAFLRRVGLNNEEIQRLCRVNLMSVRRGPAR